MEGKHYQGSACVLEKKWLVEEDRSTARSQRLSLHGIIHLPLNVEMAYLRHRVPHSTLAPHRLDTAICTFSDTQTSLSSRKTCPVSDLIHYLGI
mmetsp:Transcript_10544/g.64732  ORF Transcript_10544/g.64732 Transcript_10544/m.64732 type:complete len:94 (-) Transcript_10544:4941-5222(-)